MHSMRILMVCGESPWPTRSGGKKEKLGVRQALVSAGASVLTYVSDHGSVVERLVAGGDSVEHDVLLSRRAGFVATSVRSPVSPYQVASHRRPSLEVIGEIERWAPTHVLSHQEWVLPLSRYFAQRLSVPLTMRSHNNEAHFLRQMYLDSPAWSRRRLYLWSEYVKTKHTLERGGFYRDLSYVFTITPEDVRLYEDRGLRTLYVPPVLFCNAGSKISSLKSQSICFIGNLSIPQTLSGLAWFLTNVWPVVRDSCSEATFDIIGRSSGSELLHSQKEGVLPGVVFHGEVDDLSKFLSNARVIVNPVFGGSGVNMKVGDALEWGIPLVTTSTGARGLGCLRDSISVADNPDDFAEYCVRLLSDRDLATEQIVSQNSVSRSFSVESVGSAYVDALCDV